MKINITYIQCNVNDESDGDEIYLKYHGRKIWPRGLFKAIKTGHTLAVDIDIEVPFDEYINLELWEYDLLSKDDHLGVFTMRSNEVGGPYQTSLKLNNQEYMASYLLTWEAENN